MIYINVEDINACATFQYKHAKSGVCNVGESKREHHKVEEFPEYSSTADIVEEYLLQGEKKK